MTPKSASQTATPSDARSRIAAAAREIAERDAGPAKPAPRTAATPRPRAKPRPRQPQSPAVAASPSRALPTEQAPPTAPAPPTYQAAAAYEPPPTYEAPAAQGPPPTYQAAVTYEPPTYQGPRTYQAPPPAAGSSKADAAFVLGIISLFVNVFFIPGILAIVWGGRERRENSKARSGFVLGIIGTSLSALATVLLIVIFAAAGSAVKAGSSSTVDTLPPQAGSPAVAPKSATYTVGQTAKTGTWQATVYGSVDPFEPTESLFAASAGSHYVAVDVQVTNMETKAQTYSSLLGFHLLDSANRQYGEAFVPGLSPDAPGGQVGPGQSIRGMVGFEVPDGTTGLRMRVQGSLTATGAVWVL